MPAHGVGYAGEATIRSVDWSLHPSASAVLAAASDGVMRVLELRETHS